MQINSNNSFALFLNIILGLLLVGSIVFSYFFGNFGGISIKELRENYITKDNLKFSDLPDVIKDEYVKKDAVLLKPSSVDGLEKVFDEFGNPLEVIEGDMEDLQAIIKSLQDRVLYLEQENLLISNDKNELLKIVQNEKSTRKIEESDILSKNLEKINEAEQQHYKNISELTMKINDLQRENISLSDRLNNEKQALNDEIEKLKVAVQNEKNRAKLNESEALKVKDKEYEELQAKFEQNTLKIQELNKLLKEQRENGIIQNAKKDKQIVALQNKINTLIIQKNNLLTQNSQSVLDLEKKSSKKLEKIEQTIKQYQEDKRALKQSYEELLGQVKTKLNATIATLKDENENLKTKMDQLSQESLLNAQNAEKNLQNKENEYKNLLQKAQETFNFKLVKLKTQNEQLNQELKSKQDELAKISKELEKIKVLHQESADEILQLNDKLTALSAQNRNVDEEVEKKVAQNEIKHNKNYKFLNEQVASLELKVKNLKNNSTKTLEQLKKLYEGQLDTLKSKYTALNSLLLQTQDMLKEKQAKIASLNKSIEKINSAKKDLELSEHEKLIQIRKSFEDLKVQISKKEQEYKSQIANLQKQIEQKEALLASKSDDEEKLKKYLTEINSLKKTLKSLEGEIVSSDTVPISDKKRKLALLGSIECDDMNSGNFRISSTCKTKVKKFLSKFSASNYFEVIPIVGKGGFGSLNLMKKKSDLVSDAEIDRLTNLANLGLGKHRAKEGGWLIREQFGDFAKISYTVYNIEADNKRGFVIRVYR